MPEVAGLRRLVRFVPGPAVALVGPRVVGLVADDPRSALVKRLFAAVLAGADLDEVIEQLAGAGVSTLPSFGLVSIESPRVRVIVRGEVAAAIEPPDTGPVATISAGDVRTWVEHVEKAAGSVQLYLHDDLSDLGAFEVATGLVPACRIGLGPTDRGTLDPYPSASSLLSSAVPVAAPAIPPPFEPGQADRSIAQPSVVEPDVADISDPAAGGAEGESPVSEVDEGDPADDDASEHDASPDGAAERPSTEQPVQAPSDEKPAADGRQRRESVDTLIGPFDETGDSSHPPDAQSEGVEASDYDHLFGATQFRTVEDAAVRPEDESVAERDESDAPGAPGAPLISSIPAPPAAPPRPHPGDSDHDGRTMTLAELRAAQGSIPSPPVSADVRDAPSGAPMVHAIRCPVGHLNPTHSSDCRICGAALSDQDHVTVPRPVLGVLRFVDGRQVELTRPLLVGRAPRAEGSMAGDLPQLVTVASPLKEVSGTHLEVRLEGWQVLVVDRQSTNGTVITLPGRDPQRLRPGEPFPITIGTAVNLAEESEFTFEAPE